VIYERRHHPLAPMRVYRRRQLASLGVAAIVLGASLAAGVAGYHWLGGLAWLDALVNASMILGGMGPVDPITRGAGKWFASAYALYSGVALLTSVGIIFAPAVHRLLHMFHVDADDAGDRSQRR
jgi:hypothetical protein